MKQEPVKVVRRPDGSLREIVLSFEVTLGTGSVHRYRAVFHTISQRDNKLYAMVVFYCYTVDLVEKNKTEKSWFGFSKGSKTEIIEEETLVFQYNTNDPVEVSASCAYRRTIEERIRQQSIEVLYDVVNKAFGPIHEVLFRELQKKK